MWCLISVSNKVTCYAADVATFEMSETDRERLESWLRLPTVSQQPGLLG